MLDKKSLKEKRNRQLWIILIVSILEIILTPLAAYLVHQILSVQKMMENTGSFQISYNYFQAVKMVFVNEKVRLWYFLIQLSWVSYLAWMFFAPKASISDIREMKITDAISIPVPVGNGQHGNERFSKESEKKSYFEEFLFDGSNYLNKKGGLVVEMIPSKGKEIIRYVKEDLHAIIIGASGSGKTRRVLLQTVWLQLLSGLSVVVTDVKGEIYYYTSKFARLMKYKIITLDFRNPKKSMHFNFLQQILDEIEKGDIPQAIDYTWDLVSVLVGESKGEKIWYNGETASLAAGILAVCLEAETQHKNLSNVYYFIANMCKPDPETGIVPLNLFLEGLPDDHPAKSVFAMAEIAPYRTKASFYTSALGTLRLFTNPNVASMNAKSDFKLVNISKQKTIVYLIIPDEKKTLYPLVSMFIQQLYISQVQVANENGGVLPVCTDYDLDESGNIPTIPILANGITAGRSRGIRFNLVIQAYQQLEKKYKDDYTTILSNCQIKIYLKSDDDKTLSMLSRALGKYTVEVKSASASSSTKSSNYDVNISNGSNMTGRELLSSTEIGRFQAPYALVYYTGNRTSVTRLPDLSEYQVNEVWGLGDQAHNQKIIMEREREREEQEYIEVELWGIWNLYKELIRQMVEDEKKRKRSKGKENADEEKKRTFL